MMSESPSPLGEMLVGTFARDRGLNYFIELYWLSLRIGMKLERSGCIILPTEVKDSLHLRADVETY